MLAACPILFLAASVYLADGSGAPPAAAAADARTAAADQDVRRWIAELGSDQFRVRQNASFALLRAGLRSLPLLLEAVDSRDAEVSRRATDLLLAFCQADDDTVAWAAREALVRIAAKPAHPAANRVANALRRMEGELARRAVRELQKLGAVIYESDQGTRVMLGRAYRGGASGMVMLESLPHLVSLTIQQADVQDADFAHLRSQQELETLSVVDVGVGDEALAQISGLVRLKSLYFARTELTSAGLVHVKNLSNLTYLSLQNSRKITDEGLAHLARLVRLKALDLGYTSISDAGLAALKPLRSLELLNLNGTRVSGPGLRDLDLTSLKQLELQTTAFTDAGMEILKRVSPDFNYLDMEGTAITDAGLAAIAGTKELWYLNLSHTKVTDEGLAQIKHLAQLRTLQLSGCGITGTGLRHLGEHEISELRLDRTAVDDGGLAELKNHRFRSLGLQYTRITDDGLRALKDLEQLDWLYLDGTAITDDGLVHLAALENLRGLSLAETNVTEEGVKTLERALFKCRITR
jgi:hypothetical protein